MHKRWKTGLAALLSAALTACSPVGVLNLLVPKSGYQIVRDLAYGSDPRQRLDIYVPDKHGPNMPVMLFFYGGSWQDGSKSLYLALGQAFASQGVLVAVADYRLYPQVNFPIFLEDSARAFVYVRDHAGHYGGDPKRLFLVGHSAGAYNAVMLASDRRYLEQAGASLSDVCGVIGIAGPYNFLPLVDPALIALFGGADRPETQPISYIDGARPPMLFTAGAADTVVSPHNASDMAEKLKRFGNRAETITYPGVGHIGIILSLAPGFRFRTSLRADMLRFIQSESARCDP